MPLRQPVAIAFDCYGTLLDVTDDSFVRACGAILTALGAEHDPGGFWQTWLAASRRLAIEHGRDPENPLAGDEPDFLSFRERWPQTFLGAFEDAGIGGDAVAAYEAFHDTLCAGVAYPDVPPAIERLRPRFRIAVVSNADDDHLHQALAANGLTFEFILSSEGARSYKPRGPIFQQAAERFDLPASDILYVGDSPLMDVLGARHAGMQTAWLNRLGATLPERVPPPDIEVPDLSVLADALMATSAK